jgi:heme A synthase
MSFFRFLARIVGFLTIFLLIFMMVPRETLGGLPDHPLFHATGSSGCFLA